MSQHSKLVEKLIDEARRLMWSGDERYESVNFDDDNLREKLSSVARLRPPTLADLDKAMKEIEHDIRIGIQRDVEFLNRCHARRDDLRVFYVYNTNDNRLIVLARDAACARHFAFHRGHILNKNNGRVMVMNEADEAELRRSGKALGRALRDGYPGVITQLGENIVNEEWSKVYTPMTVIE